MKNKKIQHYIWRVLQLHSSGLEQLVYGSTPVTIIRPECLPYCQGWDVGGYVLFKERKLVNTGVAATKKVCVNTTL